MNFEEPDFDEALRRLTALNRTQTSQGVVAADMLSWEGFYIWWFGQDCLLRGFILSMMRYRRIIELSLANGVAQFVKPPRKFSLFVVPVLRRLGVKCSCVETSTSWEALRGGLGSCLKATVSLLGTVSCILRPGKILLYNLRPVDAELGCDLRLQDIYSELWRRRLPFIEIIFSVGNSRALDEQRARGRIGIYYRQLTDSLARFLPSRPAPTLSESAGSRIDRALFEEYWSYSVANLWRTRILRRLLQILRPSSLLILDDNREMFSLIAAAKVCGVPTVSFQHGPILPRFHVGLFCYGRGGKGRNHAADTYWVWSEYFRQRLLSEGELFTEEQVRVGGPIRRLSRRETVRERDVVRRRVLWIGEQLSPPEEIEPYIEEIVGAGRFQIRYRPRGDRLDKGNEEIIRNWELPIEIGEPISLEDDLAGADIVIGAYSSILYESYLQMIPSVFMLISPDIVDYEKLEAAGLRVAFGSDKIRSVLEGALETSDEDLLTMQRFLWGEADQQGYMRVVDQVEATLTTSGPSSGRAW